MINYTFLLIGLIYVTILPGFVTTEFLLPKLEFWKKLPLYFFLSIIVSCLFSYLAALIFGLTRLTLLGCFLVFLALLIVLLWKRKLWISKGIENYWQVILVGALIYSAFFVALLPAIFNYHDGYFVMSGPNWQDTTMHLSIIESLTQGNFPPQAPYFSGQPLSYYYFSDFHAAIVNIFFGKFFPQVLTLLDPFLAMTFFFSVYALSFAISKKKKFSLIAGLTASLYGNLEFINLFKTLIAQHANYFSLITNNAFNYDQNLLQMTPMADYFLQNRPMMVGLPAFMLVILLLWDSIEKKKADWIKISLAGFITASLLKFQAFGFLAGWIFFGIYLLSKLITKKANWKKLPNYFLVFGIWSFILFLISIASKIGSRSLMQVVSDSFSWGAWQKHNLKWFLRFVIGNLNIGFLIYVAGFFLLRVWRDVKILALYLTSFILLTIPFVMKFTIYEFDMLKFLYYLIPLICVLLAYFYSRSRHKKFAITFFAIVMIISSLTSVTLLFHSFLNKSMGYTMADYEAGMWVRENTPENSVFVTMPTVHSAPTDIGGRLRIISYINWPYSHGFNVGVDNVFSRVNDVTNVYETGDIDLVKVKYKASFVFYGGEEKSQFPDAWVLFAADQNLREVYDKDGIKIYKIIQ